MWFKSLVKRKNGLDKFHLSLGGIKLFELSQLYPIQDVQLEMYTCKSGGSECHLKLCTVIVYSKWQMAEATLEPAGSVYQ